MDRRTNRVPTFPVASFYLAPLCLSVSLVALAVEPEIVSDRENEREVVGVGRAGWLAAWTRERVGQRGGGRARAEQDEGVRLSARSNPFQPSHHRHHLPRPNSDDASAPPFRRPT